MCLNPDSWNTRDKAPRMVLRIVTIHKYHLFYMEKMFRLLPITPRIPLPTLLQQYAAICVLVFQMHAPETRSLAFSDLQKNDSYFVKHTARSPENGEGARVIQPLRRKSNRSTILVETGAI